MNVLSVGRSTTSWVTQPGPISGRSVRAARLDQGFGAMLAGGGSGAGAVRGGLGTRVGCEHGAEQGALLDRVVERDMTVRKVAEPTPRHGALHRRPVFGTQHGHGVGLDVQCRMREGA